ncbi:MAG: DUF2723 domain-containing protein [Prolixibacteraceae bacterium]
MKSFKLVNNLVGWGVFLLSLVVYYLTLEPSVSFWDCGEFIAASYKLQIGHPPGAPFFQLIQRVVSLFAPNTNKVALFMNAFSGTVSAATILFLYWTIVRLAERMLSESTKNNQLLMMTAGVVGSLTFAFSDSFWFSAVEAEVYAFSSLFTAMVFWAILKWEQVAFEKQANRWIVLIAYLIGLSIGVHLLNLLAIPAIGLIWYFKKYQPTAKGIIATLVISAITIAFIMYGLVQGTPTMAQNFEILFVNSFGLPYNSGMLFFILLLVGALIGLSIYAHKKSKPLLNLVAISVLVIYIGFGSYAMLMVRSNANPPMDENSPENAYTLMKYLNRSQYGDTPIFTGYYYNAPALGMEEGAPVYYPKDGKYIKSKGTPSYSFDPRFKTIFPRMYSSSDNHVNGYKMWGNIKGRPVNVNGKTDYIPTFSENIRYFISYQINHMYIRYFMWNFAGRQNDQQGHGNVLDGNWLTGIGFIDAMRLGYSGDQPSSMSNPETTNRYYMLPFLLGLVGLFFQLKRNKNDFWVVMLLFLMTGLAIVVYLNQSPYQPRERDYAYVGSFYAFAIWIGLGVMGVAQFLNKYLKNKALIPTVVLTALIPLLVLSENYDDHDRSNRYIARDLGRDYLRSCAKNAILFTYGDNDTFPLWYVQDVENERPDVRICNVTLLNGDWYIDQMKNKVYESDPLPILMEKEKYENDVRNTLFVRDDLNYPVELSTLMKIALSDSPKAKLKTQGGGSYNYFPTHQFKITVDKEQVLKTGTVAPEKAALIEDSIVIRFEGNYLTKSDLAILDLLSNNNWERPIYFDLSVVYTSSLKLDQYLQHEGFAYRLVPIKSATPDPSIDVDILYNRLMTRYEWGNLGDPDIFLDENTYRTVEVVQIKNNFYKLSTALLNQGDKIRAKEVVDKLYEILPLGRFHCTYFDIVMAGNYYQLNELEKGDRLMETVANEGFEKVEFYLSLGGDYVGQFQREANRDINIIREVVRVTTNSNRTALSEKLETRLNDVIQNFGNL